MGKVSKKDQGVRALVMEFRRAGFDEETVFNLIAKIMEVSAPFELTALKAEIEMHAKSSGSYKMQELIRLNDLYRVADTNDVMVINNKTRKRHTIKDKALEALFSAQYVQYKAKSVFAVYDPASRDVEIETDSVPLLNTYSPPDWYAEIFYKTKQATEFPMPQVVHEFLIHLLDNDMESYEFLLKWLANSLVDRNFTYLVTVGAKGVGKGLLYSLWRLLMGRNNSNHTLAKSFFTSTFNSELKDIKAYYIDEVSKMSQTDIDRLKYMVNDTIRIEGKGKDAIFIDNYVNIMMSSNNIADFNEVIDDRRLSFMSLTSKKSKDVWGDGPHDAMIKDLLSDKTVSEFGQFLLTQVKFTPDEMKEGFKGKSKMKEIRAVSLKDWEDYFLFSYAQDNAGQNKPLTEVSSEVMSGANTKVRPSRDVLRELKGRFPGFYTLSQMDGKGGRKGAASVHFTPLKNQPRREDFDLVIEGEE